MKKLKLTLLIAIISLGLGLGTSAAVKNTVKKAPVKAPVAVEKTVTTPKAKVVAEKIDASYQLVSPLDVVAHPDKYLNKKIRIKAQFDKFSTLGLDYKPAFRSSDKYITFLIKRDDVVNHTVPLSEMKNFLLRDEAEKYIDLKPGDLVEYGGVVFSNALGDTWVSVDKFIVVDQKSKTQDSKKK